MKPITDKANALYAAARATALTTAQSKALDTNIVVRAAYALATTMLAHSNTVADMATTHRREVAAQHASVVLRRMEGAATSDAVLRDVEIMLLDAAEYVAATGAGKARAAGVALESLSDELRFIAALRRAAGSK